MKVKTFTLSSSLKSLELSQEAKSEEVTLFGSSIALKGCHGWIRFLKSLMDKTEDGHFEDAASTCPETISLKKAALACSPVENNSMEESRNCYRKYCFLTWKCTSNSSETWQKMEGERQSRFQKGVENNQHRGMEVQTNKGYHLVSFYRLWKCTYGLLEEEIQNNIYANNTGNKMKIGIASCNYYPLTVYRLSAAWNDWVCNWEKSIFLNYTEFYRDSVIMWQRWHYQNQNKYIHK